MKAMILAAGLGTRLKPLTDRIPKALVEVGGVPMLERVILKLKGEGFDYIVVNVHHFSEQIIDFLKTRDYGVEIAVSDESERLLDTGGGIVNARRLLFGRDHGPVLIHNVDILSNAELRSLVDKDEMSLLVSDRESSRKLIFDPEMDLRGWRNLTSGQTRPENLNPEPEWRDYAFSGIYSMTEQGVEEMKNLMGEGAFPVMDYFLSERRIEQVKGIVSTNLKIIDIGKPATLSQASDLNI
ncbi:MAG: NTP transferase domain-containing protein [Muribaculaceae bacterium]|nr:NTP transferase domain-containing protein [Muribaculaceae bacterium]